MHEVLSGETIVNYLTSTLQSLRDPRIIFLKFNFLTSRGLSIMPFEWKKYVSYLKINRSVKNALQHAESQFISWFCSYFGFTSLTNCGDEETFIPWTAFRFFLTKQPQGFAFWKKSCWVLLINKFQRRYLLLSQGQLANILCISI